MAQSVINGHDKMAEVVIGRTVANVGINQHRSLGYLGHIVAVHPVVEPFQRLSIHRRGRAQHVLNAPTDEEEGTRTVVVDVRKPADQR